MEKIRAEREKENERKREYFMKVLEENDRLKNKMENEASASKIRLRKDFVRQLELERMESTLSGVMLKAQEVAVLQQQQMEQEEKLAAEMDLIKRKEIVDEKLRQHLRENSHELKELESQLKAAYVKKALAAQLAEKEENKLQEQIREKHARALLDRALGHLEEQEIEAKVKEKMERDKFKQCLQDQIIVKERIRQEEFVAFMKEKKMFDDVIQTIKDEDIKELERKKLTTQKFKEEMRMFQSAKEIWKAKERLRIQEEEEERKKILEEKERVKLKLEDEKIKQNRDSDKLFQALFKNISEKQAKQAEKEELISTLLWIKTEEEERKKMELELEKNRITQEESRESFRQLLEEKSRKKKEEKELDDHFFKLMKAKMDEDERKEKEKQAQRREALINNRKYNEEEMKRNIQKRAEALKLNQLIDDLQENEEKKKAEMIEEERIRMLKAHAHSLLGYFPKGCLKEKDLEILGLTAPSPNPQS